MSKKFYLLSLLIFLSGPLSAQLKYSGSDTVEPVVSAALNAYKRGHVNFSLASTSLGSSAGLHELCTGRSALVGASRPMKPKEQAECDSAKISPIEVPVGYDAVVLVVSRKTSFVNALSIAEVKRIFDPSSAGKVMTWKDVRPSLPSTRLLPVGVGFKHGTFEFFHTAIGNGNFVRGDFKDTNHHADTAMIVANDIGAIGYMPLADAKDFSSQLQIVSIDFGYGAIEPNAQSVSGGKYSALSRMVYLYVNKPMLSKQGSDALGFVKELIENLEKYTTFSNMMPLSSLQYQENSRRANL